jgi:hypothetical protein
MGIVWTFTSSNSRTWTQECLPAFFTVDLEKFAFYFIFKNNSLFVAYFEKNHTLFDLQEYRQLSSQYI